MREVKGARGSAGEIVSSRRTRLGPGSASRTLIFATTCRVGGHVNQFDQLA